MAKTSIFQEIDQKQGSIKTQDLDAWIIPSLLEEYDPKIKYLASHAYSVHPSESGYELAVRAFRERSKAKIREALETFFFKKQHWKQNNNLNAYLKATLRNLSNSLYWEGATKSRTAKPICPLCKAKNGAKQGLHLENGKLRCDWCTKYAQVIIEEIEKGASEDSERLRQEREARVAFSLHSKQGLRCCGCLRFIPKSLIEEGFVACPYEDCDEFGETDHLMAMTHPMSVAAKSSENLENLEDKGGPNLESTSLLQDNSGFSKADSLLEAKDDFQHKLKLIQQVIKEQKAAVNRTNQKTKVQKSLMYDAFAQVLEEQPDDMIRYLCHRKYSFSDPIQSKIYQKYGGLVEDYLPFTIKYGQKEKDIVSLTDPELSLFTGISEYTSKVQADGTIPNETKEVYIGGREYKNHGPCFIGKLIEVQDEQGNSLLPQVVEYTFSKISTQGIEEGTRVQVTHFRIPSHYEMKGLVFLQRIRRKLVDSIYFRLHKKKRKVNS